MIVNKKLIKKVLLVYMVVISFAALVRYNNEILDRNGIDSQRIFLRILSPPKIAENIITESRSLEYVAEDERRKIRISLCNRNYPPEVEPPKELEEFIVVPDYDECVASEIAGLQAHIYRVGGVSHMVCAVSSTCCVDFIYMTREFSDEEVSTIARELYVFK